MVMAAEMLVGVLLASRSPAVHLALYREPSYALGLLTQIGFALMPLLQLRFHGARH
jgi:hypothetical protein